MTDNFTMCEQCRWVLLLCMECDSDIRFTGLAWRQNCSINLLCPKSLTLSLPHNPRLPGSGWLADAPYQHPGLCKQEQDSHETCSLISAIVYYFWQCPLFEVWWSLRDAVNFQSCEIQQMHKNKQKDLLLVLAVALELHPLRFKLQIWLSCLLWAP